MDATSSQDALDLLELDLTSRDHEFEWAAMFLQLKARTFRKIHWPLLDELVCSCRGGARLGFAMSAAAPGAMPKRSPRSPPCMAVERGESVKSAFSRHRSAAGHAVGRAQRGGCRASMPKSTDGRRRRGSREQTVKIALGGSIWSMYPTEGGEQQHCCRRVGPLSGPPICRPVQIGASGHRASPTILNTPFTVGIRPRRPVLAMVAGAQSDSRPPGTLLGPECSIYTGICGCGAPFWILKPLFEVGHPASATALGS